MAKQQELKTKEGYKDITYKSEVNVFPSVQLRQGEIVKLTAKNSQSILLTVPPDLLEGDSTDIREDNEAEEENDLEEPDIKPRHCNLTASLRSISTDNLLQDAIHAYNEQCQYLFRPINDTESLNTSQEDLQETDSYTQSYESCSDVSESLDNLSDHLSDFEDCMPRGYIPKQYEMTEHNMYYTLRNRDEERKTPEGDEHKPITEDDKAMMTLGFNKVTLEDTVPS